MGFANAILQLLVHPPPFWNLFRVLGDLNGRRRGGGPKTGGSTTPLVDAKVSFFEEFKLNEKENLPMKRPPHQAANEKPREDEENKVADSFEPTNMYDAMKQKKQLKHLLVRSTYSWLRCALLILIFAGFLCKGWQGWQIPGCGRGYPLLRRGA